MNEKKSTILLAVAYISIYIVLPIFYIMLFNSSRFATGLRGYIAKMILRGTLIVAGIILIKKSILANDSQTSEQTGKANKKKIPWGLILGLALVLFEGWRFIRGLGDIPYLNDPKVMVLTHLAFNDSADDENNSVDGIYGIDESGKFRSFNISDEMFTEAKNTLPIDYKLDVTDESIQAKVYYLPGTHVIMKLEYLYG